MARSGSSRRLLAGLVSVVLASGCSVGAQHSGEQDQLRLARRYFHDNNAAARRGPAAQQEFLRRAQHPDYSADVCDLGAMTVTLDPVLSTLRPDPTFSPGGITPRGEIWVVAVEVTVRRNGVVSAHQVGSQHLVHLSERVYGFTPCPS